MNHSGPFLESPWTEHRNKQIMALSCICGNHKTKSYQRMFIIDADLATTSQYNTFTSHFLTLHYLIRIKVKFATDREFCAFYLLIKNKNMIELMHWARTPLAPEKPPSIEVTNSKRVKVATDRELCAFLKNITKSTCPTPGVACASSELKACMTSTEIANRERSSAPVPAVN